MASRKFTLGLCVFGCGLGLAAAAPTQAQAQDDLFGGGKLLLTSGVSNLEGAGGGGLASWALITGYGTDHQIGADAHFTYDHLGDYDVRDFGAAVGFFDRVEVSYARLQLDTGSTGRRLGLGSGYTFNEDVVGAKVKLVGDAVYDQDRLLPQIAAGVQFKHSNDGDIDRLLGAKHDSGVDYYISATKIFFDQSLLLDATVRATKANQLGLLGFGGDRGDGYSAQFEGSAAYLVTRRLAVGGEYRTKPSNLSFSPERDWADIFAAYTFNRHLSLTLAYTRLGTIATIKNQNGVYVSVQTGF